jgi:hypothetical protein
MSDDLPIAAVGTAAAAQSLEAQAPGQLSVRAVPDRAAALQAIAERDVYGAVVLDRSGVRELMVAPAANNGVANFLRQALGAPTPEGTPRITNVKPLPDASNSEAIATLAIYAGVGLIVVLALSLVRRRPWAAATPAPRGGFAGRA